MEISKTDWKLFCDMLPEWQERYMERLDDEYSKLYDYLMNNKEANINDILDYTFEITGTEEEEFEIE